MLILIWAVAGIVVGFLIWRFQLWLTHREELKGSRSWPLYGVMVVVPLLFALLARQLGWGSALLIRSLWIAVLVQIASFDLEYRLIVDRVMLPAVGLAVALIPLTPGLSWRSGLLAALIAGLIALGIALLGEWIFKADALGLGDVKLVAFIGLILGMKYSWTALLVGVILAGVVAGALLLLRCKGLRDTIAYGPFLAAGALLGLFLMPSQGW
ncbi:MAG: prepilin peptidase [Candidatus Dormibacteraceae bacterium]